MRIDTINKEQISDLQKIDFIYNQTGLKVDKILCAKSYWINTEFDEHIHNYGKDLLRDPVCEKLLYSEMSLNEIDFDFLIEVSFKPGVTDNRALATKEAFELKFNMQDKNIATGDLYFIKTKLNSKKVHEIAHQCFGNNLIQKIRIYKKEEVQSKIPSPNFPAVKLSFNDVTVIDLDVTDEQLIQLNKSNLWALSLDEIKQISNHYKKKHIQILRKDLALPKSPTDLEMEIFAQSWSEHCKHKIFNAEITYTEDVNTQKPIGSKKVKSLFKDYIFKSTYDVQKKFNIDWLISVFKDNAGIVRFDDNIDYCFKVETHNSPSALDPYGGALTGILGVNRDILGCGLGATPIGNTNVLCFAPPNYDKEILNQLPKKLKHPLSILRGVHKGIEDGGNKSGIPTVNGSLHFHDNYAGKPLVYCGTVGAIPQQINELMTSKKYHKPGDFIVICGGSVGADGVHGATFSSMELDDQAPATAVQIGDPFTQKRLTDFLIEARDQSLFTALTDNGAGGLSSSVGEMAEQTNGARINIQNIPLKYPGLKPYEIIISESQERMTFAVAPPKLQQFVELAKKRNVNPAVIGEFNNSGSFQITDGDKVLADVNLDFLHNGLAPMKLEAHFENSSNEILWHNKTYKHELENLDETVKRLLAHNNIKSKENLVRQYDHEVKASTVVKPFVSNKLSSPSDSAVLWTKLSGGDEKSAIAIGHGLAPQYSHIDTYMMTQIAIDEAIRNVVSSGANPKFIALCDNFCWPDPIVSKNNPDAKYKLAQLVRSAQALYDTAMVYGTPFVSGKDSMKNDFIGKDINNDLIKISVPPTLLISSLAKLDNVENFLTTDFKEVGDYVYYIGPEVFTKNYYSTHLPHIKEIAPIELDLNKKIFNTIYHLNQKSLLASCHDISEGGVITAILESSFSNKIGVQLNSNCIDAGEQLDSFLFNEMTAGFIVSIPQEKHNLFKALNLGIPTRFIGLTIKEQKVELKNKFSLDIDQMYQIWSTNDY